MITRRPTRPPRPYLRHERRQGLVNSSHLQCPTPGTPAAHQRRRLRGLLVPMRRLDWLLLPHRAALPAPGRPVRDHQTTETGDERLNSPCSPPPTISPRRPGPGHTRLCDTRSHISSGCVAERESGPGTVADQTYVRDHRRAGSLRGVGASGRDAPRGNLVRTRIDGPGRLSLHEPKRQWTALTAATTG